MPPGSYFEIVNKISVSQLVGLGVCSQRNNIKRNSMFL